MEHTDVEGSNLPFSGKLLRKNFASAKKPANVDKTLAVRALRNSHFPTNMHVSESPAAPLNINLLKIDLLRQSLSDFSVVKKS